MFLRTLKTANIDFWGFKGCCKISKT